MIEGAPRIFDFTLRSLEGQPLPLSQFEGKVMLVVNTASQCGFTPQYAGLEALHQEYQDRGLVVLGCPPRSSAASRAAAQRPNASCGGALCAATCCRSLPAKAICSPAGMAIGTPLAPNTCTLPARTVTVVVPVPGSTSTWYAPGCDAVSARFGVSISKRCPAGSSRTRAATLPCVTASCSVWSFSVVNSTLVWPDICTAVEPTCSSERAPLSFQIRSPCVSGRFSTAAAHWS